jgi:hypothetical protein
MLASLRLAVQTMNWPWTSRRSLLATEKGWQEATCLCHQALSLCGKLQAENAELRDKLLLQTTKANRLAGMIREADQEFLKQVGVTIC